MHDLDVRMRIFCAPLKSTPKLLFHTRVITRKAMGAVSYSSYQPVCSFLRFWSLLSLIYLYTRALLSLPPSTRLQFMAHQFHSKYGNFNKNWSSIIWKSRTFRVTHYQNYRDQKGYNTSVKKGFHCWFQRSAEDPHSHIRIMSSFRWRLISLIKKSKY